MKRGNQKRGAVEVFLTREFFNSLMTSLTAFEAVSAQNKYSGYALRIKNKIMRYSRRFTHDGEEQIVTYFYEDEAAMLIKLLAIYCHVIAKPSADFFSETGRNHNKEEAENANP